MLCILILYGPKIIHVSSQDFQGEEEERIVSLVLPEYLNLKWFTVM